MQSAGIAFDELPADGERVQQPVRHPRRPLTVRWSYL
jgi:hypothetical protein